MRNNPALTQERGAAPSEDKGAGTEPFLLMAALCPWHKAPGWEGAEGWAGAS